MTQLCIACAHAQLADCTLLTVLGECCIASFVNAKIVCCKPKELCSRSGMPNTHFLLSLAYTEGFTTALTGCATLLQSDCVSSTFRNAAHTDSRCLACVSPHHMSFTSIKDMQPAKPTFKHGTCKSSAFPNTEKIGHRLQHVLALPTTQLDGQAASVQQTASADSAAYSANLTYMKA